MRNKREKKSISFFIKHKFICDLTSANKKRWQHIEMHIKDLESVFTAQTPWKSDLKHVRSGTRQQSGAGCQKPKAPVSPPVIYESPFQLMGNDNGSEKQHQERLNKWVFPTTDEKTRICYTSRSKWRKSTDFECDKNITKYCHFFCCLQLIFLSVTSR